VKPLDLNNLPKDPAQEANSQSNEVETEEDGIRAEALRRLQVRQLSKARREQTQES
jgi:hypothetical protein